jgi:hypothetical protein
MLETRADDEKRAIPALEGRATAERRECLTEEAVAARKMAEGIV